MGSPDRRAPQVSERRFSALCALAALALLALGLLLGRAIAPTGQPRAAAPAKAGAAREVAGVPVSFPHTRRGAAAAVAAYQRAFATPAILRPGVLRARIEAVASPDYVATMLAANSPGRQRIAAGPIGVGLRAGVRTVYLTVPIGYRIESYSPTRARILTWGFTLLGNLSVAEPAAYFGVAHTELVWSRGRWWIAETRAGFGPTPRLATPPGPLGSYRVIGLASRLRNYELAP